MDKLIDYRGDCWKAYLDVGLCLRILPPGESFEFLVEKDKLIKIRKVVFHNGGEVVSEIPTGSDVHLTVRKAEDSSLKST